MPETPEKKLTDADVMKGGPEPAEGEKSPEKATELKEVTIKGKKFTVDPGLAEALEDYRRELNERDGKRGSELETLRRQVGDLEAAVRRTTATPKPDATLTPEPVGPKPPDPGLAFVDPPRYQRELLEYMDAAVSAREKKLREDYEQARTQDKAEEQRQKTWQAYVGRFYESNPDLKGEEDLVDLVWKSHFTELKDLSLDDGFTKLANLTRERMLRYTGKVRTPEESPTHLESSGPRAPAPRRSEDEKPSSLSSIIRARQARQRAGKPSKE